MPPHAPTQVSVSSSGRAEAKKDGSALVTRDYLIDRSEKDNWSAMDHIIWMNVFWFSLLHVTALYGAYLAFTQAKLLTVLWGRFFAFLVDFQIVQIRNHFPFL